jgi:hypothetical protein
MDILGHSPGHLRIVTLCIHFVNAVLLIYWTMCVYERNIRFNKSALLFCSSAVAVLFVVHPLNAEIVGWLSAQSYAPALSFGLLSSICLERMVSISLAPASSSSSSSAPSESYWWQTCSVVCYCLACLVCESALCTCLFTHMLLCCFVLSVILFSFVSSTAFLCFRARPPQ